MIISWLKGQAPSAREVNFAAVAALFPHCVSTTTHAAEQIEQHLDLQALAAALGLSRDYEEQRMAATAAAANTTNTNNTLTLDTKAPHEAAAAIAPHVLSFWQEPRGFNWAGKEQALQEALQPTTQTLRPCLSESVSFASTANLYLEGDNLTILQLLQASYRESVKLIYIDPPYNTGRDLVYHDRFVHSAPEYAQLLGHRPEASAQESSTLSEERYHAKWCSFMYQRLLLARTLLRPDGVICLSIDDNEQHHLREICDEIFGEQNLVAQFMWQRAYAPKNDATHISATHDYVLMYARDKSRFVMGTLPLTTAHQERAIDNGDPRGPWLPCALTISQWAQPLATLGSTAQELSSMAAPVSTQAAATAHTNSTDSLLLYHELYLSGQRRVLPQGQRWLFSAEQVQSFAAQQRLFWPQHEDLHSLRPVRGQRAQLDKSTLELLEQAAAQHLPVLKCYILEDGAQGMVPHTLWTNKDIGSNHDGVKDLKRVMAANVFDGAKPVALVQRLMHLAQVQAHQGDIILDFFSGSATTAEAVMRANCEDGSKRRFIMVQLQEQCSPDKPAAKAGFADLCALGRTRIRKAAHLLQEEFQNTVYDSNISVQSAAAAQARAAGRMAVDFGFRDFVLTSGDCTATAAGETTDHAAAYGVAQGKTAMAVTLALADSEAEASALHLTSGAECSHGERPLDLLFRAALEVGLPLSLPYSCLQVAEEYIHVLQDHNKGRALVMCLACNLGSEVLAQLIALQPQRLLLCASAILCADTMEQVPVSSAEAQYWPLNHCGQQLLQNLSKTQVLLVRPEEQACV